LVENGAKMPDAKAAAGKVIYKKPNHGSNNKLPDTMDKRYKKEHFI